MMNTFEGRTWKFGDDINTDLMVPTFAMWKSDEEMRKYCFSANRPGWVDLVKKGDIIIGGKNFGTGSSRPGAKVLKSLGVSCLLAEIINGLFLRNCINFGLPAMPCQNVFQAFEEGDIANIDFNQGKVINKTKGIILRTTPLPEMLIKIINAGGIIPMLDEAGYLE
jgi:3-isopropylmalate/(R)-2-methylmalate dehydratase small subunit